MIEFAKDTAHRRRVGSDHQLQWVPIINDVPVSTYEVFLIPLSFGTFELYKVS